MIKMYTLEEQLFKACHIAQINTDARVVLFCNLQELKIILKDFIWSEGTYYERTCTWISDCGGSIRFVDEKNLEQVCMGAQFSHVFVNKISDYAKRDYARSRIRTTKTFTELPGFYDEFGVLRYEVY